MESHSSLDPYNPRDFHYDQQITIQNQDGKKAAKKDGISIKVNNDSLTVSMPGKSDSDTALTGKAGHPGSIAADPDIRKKIKSKQALIDKVMSRMFGPHLSIEERLSPEILKTTLNDELADNGIYLDYEFAVLKSDGQYSL